jgi:Zn-dependent M28 family amino/carboxypeptidase
VLEVARILSGLPKAPNRSLLFLFVPAEAEGLLGSDYFASRPVPEAGKIVANVNVDMPLFLFPLADLIAFGSENSTLDLPTARAAEAAGLALGPDPMPEQTVFIRSDQYSFVRRGIPAVFLVTGMRSADPAVDGGGAFGEFMGRHYHQPSDDLRLPMNQEAVSSFVRASVLLTHALAQDREAPRWKPGNFFGRTFGSPRGQVLN